MTEHGSPALDIALAYHRAWTSHDFDKAMTYIAEDIVCQAPAGRLDGAEAFRAFMGPFAQILISSSPIAAFGDDLKALLMYDTGTVRSRTPQARNASPSPTARSAMCVDRLRPGAVRRGTPSRGNHLNTAPLAVSLWAGGSRSVG